MILDHEQRRNASGRYERMYLTIPAPTGAATWQVNHGEWLTAARIDKQLLVTYCQRKGLPVPTRTASDCITHPLLHGKLRPASRVKRTTQNEEALVGLARLITGGGKRQREEMDVVYCEDDSGNAREDNTVGDYYLFEGRFLWSLAELHDRLYIGSNSTRDLWLRWQSIRREGSAACTVVKMIEYSDGHVGWVRELGEPPLYIARLRTSPKLDRLRTTPKLDARALRVWLEIGAQLVMGQLSTGREVLLCCGTGFHWPRFVIATCAVSWWGLAPVDVVAAFQRAPPLLLCPRGDEILYGPAPEGSQEEKDVTDNVEDSIWEVGGQKATWNKSLEALEELLQAATFLDYTRPVGHWGAIPVYAYKPFTDKQQLPVEEALLTVRWNEVHQREVGAEDDMDSLEDHQKMASLLTRRAIPRVSGSAEYQAEEAKIGGARDWPPKPLEGYDGLLLTLGEEGYELDDEVTLVSDGDCGPDFVAHILGWPSTKENFNRIRQEVANVLVSHSTFKRYFLADESAQGRSDGRIDSMQVVSSSALEKYRQPGEPVSADLWMAAAAIYTNSSILVVTDTFSLWHDLSDTKVTPQSRVRVAPKEFQHVVAYHDSHFMMAREKPYLSLPEALEKWPYNAYLIETERVKAKYVGELDLEGVERNDSTGWRVEKSGTTRDMRLKRTYAIQAVEFLIRYVTDLPLLREGPKGPEVAPHRLVTLFPDELEKYRDDQGMINPVFNALCHIIGWHRPITASTPMYVVDKREYLWQLDRYRHVMSVEWEGYSDSRKRLWVYPKGPWHEGPLYWFEREEETDEGELEGELKT